MLPSRYYLNSYKFQNLVMDIKNHYFIGVAVLSFLIGGCRGSSVNSIPDAPPPYPSFPVPQERYNSAQVYGGSPHTSTYVPPYSPPPTSNIDSGPTFYTPPPSIPPNNQSVSTSPSIGYAPQNVKSQRKINAQGINTTRFTLEANADLWALVQNAEELNLNG